MMLDRCTFMPATAPQTAAQADDTAQKAKIYPDNVTKKIKTADEKTKMTYII